MRPLSAAPAKDASPSRHFKNGGAKTPEGYPTDWLEHKQEIRKSVLTLPPLPEKAARKRKTVDAR